MSRPAAPNHTAGSFTIQVGLLSIPVKMFTATETARIAREQYTKGTLLPVGSAPAVKLPKATKDAQQEYGDFVDRKDIVKMYETSHGLIELTDEEISQIVTGTTGVADVLGVQPYEVYDDTYVPSGLIWQVRANRGAEKAYSLLLEALTAKESFLLLRWVRGGGTYIGALFPNGTLFGLRYEEEIRELAVLPKPELSEKELKMAVQLLDIYSEDAPLELHHPHNAIRDFAEAKAAGLTTGELAKKPSPTLTIDLAKALEDSIAAAVSRAQEREEYAEVV